jgi:hypothetical protein
MNTVRMSHQVQQIEEKINQYIQNLFCTSSVISGFTLKADEIEISIRVETYNYTIYLDFSGEELREIFDNEVAREKCFEEIRTRIIEERSNSDLVSHETAYSDLKAR